MVSQMLSGVGMGSSANISIDFSPSPFIVAAEFDKLGVNIKSFKEPLTRAIKTVMVPSFRENFDVEGRPAWDPLTDATIARRTYEGFDAGPILERTGTLRKVASQMNIWKIDGRAGTAFIADLPDRAWYGKVMQSGLGADAIDAGSIAARPWAVIQDQDAVEIEDIFLTWLEERIDADIRAGRRTSYFG